MEIEKAIDRAILARTTGQYAWYDLQRMFPELTLNQIFCRVIGECNRRQSQSAANLTRRRKRR